MRLATLFAAAFFVAPFAIAPIMVAAIQGFAAEQESPAPVVLRYAGADLVGLALSVALKEELSAASFLRLHEEATAGPHLTVIVATVDGSVEDPEKQTAASVNVLYDADTVPANGYLLTAMVQVCGITRTYECAREIVATVRAALDKLKAEHPELREALEQS